MELADQQVSENDGGLTGAEIPAAADVPAREAPAEKLTLRQEIEKNVETIRTEEAKRARAADGKFAKLDGAAEKPATAEIPKPEKDAQPAASPADGPPPIWKDIWEGMTPEARALAVKREAEVAKGFEEYRGKTAQLQEITQALDPIRPILQQNGIQSDAQAVKTLLQWEGSFRNPQTRMQAFQNLAAQYGVDLSTLVPSSQSGASTAQDIPEPLRPVIDQFGNIQQQVQGFDSRLQTFEQNQTAREVTAFAKDKPHFEKVRGRMASLMSPALDTRGQIIAPAAAQTLDEAYQQAIWMDPEIRQQMLNDQAKAKAEELANANAEKVKRAAAAAVSPTTRPPAGAPVGSSATGTGVRGSILSAVKALREEQRA
jgi:hypothetical protein